MSQPVSTCSCDIGTRQGCILSPQMFIIFINQLIKTLQIHGGQGVYACPAFENIFALMFADDVSSIAYSAIQLQKVINALDIFCSSTGMKVNLNKTKIMVFRNGGPLRSYEKRYLHGEQFEVVSSYRYLGLVFTPKLIWSKAQLCLSSQANKAVMSIYHYVKSFGGIPCKDLFKIFDCMVAPILTYGSQIWGLKYSKEVEKVQVKLGKWLLQVGRTTTNSMVLGECGRTPLVLIYMTKAVKYWCRLIQLDHCRLPCQTYQMLKLLDNNGNINWVTGIKNILFKFGFGYVWLSQEIGNVNLFITYFKQ